MLELSVRKRTRPKLRRCAQGKPVEQAISASLSGELAHLVSEMTAIHSENSRDWESGSTAIREARAELQFRQDRLEEIRAVLQTIYRLEEQFRLPAKDTTVARS